MQDEHLNFKVRNKLHDDNRQIVLEEEKKYALLKNELIEIQLKAEEGLTMLNEFVRYEAEKMREQNNLF